MKLYILVIACILLTGCAERVQQDAPPALTTPEPPAPQAEPPKGDPEPDPAPASASPTKPTPPAAATKEFDITAKKWSFEPSTITVNKGDRVILHVRSIDVTHGFTLSAFDVSETLQPSTTADIEFIADKAGSFSFVCSVFCGSGHGGMKGTLIVK